MSSPTSAPAESPPDSSASPPPSSSTPPPTSSSSPPSDPPPPSDQTPPPSVVSPPPPAPVSSPSPPAPPPESTTPSPPPPVQQSPPPAESPPPPASSSPPPAESPPPPASSSPPEQSPPPPAQSSTPPATSPLPSTASPPAPTGTVLSPPPPSASSGVSPPPPGTSSGLSPPPPPASTSTPTTPSTATPPSPASPSSGTISTGIITGIAVAAIIAVTVLLVFVLCFCKKKKKRHYYSGDHHGPPGGLPAHFQDPYYNPHVKQQGWHSPYSSQSSDVLLNMPPPPPPPPFTITEHDLASPNGNSGPSQGIGNSKSSFTYAELAAATSGFSKANLLGEGGFGCVYKGVLFNGQVVAVKQLKSGASQGEKEFQAEVEIISRVHHRHLVSLVGYCITDNQRLLVYDFVSNNTLEYHLHKKVPALDWPTRLKIASGAARGLAYLHEDCHPRIIHRDIKSANILLDNNFDAQVSDFGLAKLTSDTNTHVTTRVMGTFGYLAPEYASSGKLTEKSDVFSFGVVLLELVTGRKPVDVSQPPGRESLVEWARPILAQIEGEDDLEMLVDPSLNGAYDSKEMMRMVEAAAACVRHSANKRPRMGQVVRALEEEMSLADLNKGLKPGHSSVYGSSFSSSEYENGSYSADIRRFRRVLNEGNDTGVSTNPYSSSEYQSSLETDRDTRRPVRMPGQTAFSSSNEFSTSK